MISKEEVKHIAKLARLELTEKDAEAFQKELSSVLDYFEKLKEVEVGDVQPTNYSFETGSVMRKDPAPEPSARYGAGKEKIARKIMDLAPETKGGYLKVKSVF